ncbi:DUF1343 domain-containing protein [candidate division KSB1 bacterium]|nr:DUF1343 domain-containing protein [candidate division KSB1 bacterium]
MKKSAFRLVLSTLLISFALAGCTQESTARQRDERVLAGIDVLLSQQLDLVKRKRVGLITNPTGITSEGISTIDALYAHPDIHLVALYGPEHGVRGNFPAGEKIASGTDDKTGLPVYSLYGTAKKLTPAQLQGVDVLLFDIQDVGIRPYTYIYTMAYAMQAAHENSIPFIVLDRPNPLGGELIEGPMLKEQYASFIGLYPIPYIHGMTIGELALYFNAEFGIDAPLTVVPMRGWRRRMHFAETGLSWVPTSPHVPQATTPFYLATTGGFGELQTLNEGVGYTLPFQLVGAEWMNADSLADTLNALDLVAVFFRPVHYRPFYGHKKDILLHGVQIHISDYKSYRPVKTQIAILKTVYDLYPQQTIFDPVHLDMFYKAMGTEEIRLMIEDGRHLDEIHLVCARGLDDFVKKRKKYLLYD